MEVGIVTTPFGRRAMTVGMFSRQLKSHNVEPNQAVDKWKLYRALCEAKPMLQVSDRSLALLNALLSFYPKNELEEGSNLTVFPSNVQLSLRAHGMSEQTIRRHVALLVNAGLLIRKDSPNGKRYARKTRGGEISNAFGFSLAPLLARAEEIQNLASAVTAERMMIRQLREQISICRRDISKLTETDAQTDWDTVAARLNHLIMTIPRKPTSSQLRNTLKALELIREDVVNVLKKLLETGKLGGNPVQNERHIQNSEPESYLESEAFDATKTTNLSFQPRELEHETDTEVPQSVQPRVPTPPFVTTASEHVRPKAFPLDMVVRACPEIADYAIGGQIKSWSDLISAAAVVRSMLGVSESAYTHAMNQLGPENTASVIACILEKGQHINSAGGYLRDLARRSERGHFSVGPMLMAMVRSKGRLLQASEKLLKV